MYELFKLRLSRAVGRKPLYAHEAAVCGSVSGGIAAALTTPLDVLKTRVMLDLRVRLSCDSTHSSVAHCRLFSQDPKHQKLPSLFSRFKQIYVSEGSKALFAGVVPRTLWISAGGAVFLGVYEWAVHGLMGW